MRQCMYQSTLQPKSRWPEIWFIELTIVDGGRIHPKLLKLVYQFTFLDRNITYTKSEDSIPIRKEWAAIERPSTIWKWDIINKIKWEFLQAGALSILLHICTTRPLGKGQDGNYTRMLRTVLNKPRNKNPQNTICTVNYPTPSNKP